MNSEYITAQLRELDRSLRHVRGTREAKLIALHNFREGFEEALHHKYPNRFPYSGGYKTYVPADPNSTFYFGRNVGNAFGTLEVDSARQIILEEIEKRKTRLTKPSILKRADKFLSEIYRLCGQVPRI